MGHVWLRWVDGGHRRWTKEQGCWGVSTWRWGPGAACSTMQALCTHTVRYHHQKQHWNWKCRLICHLILRAFVSAAGERTKKQKDDGLSRAVQNDVSIAVARRAGACSFPPSCLGAYVGLPRTAILWRHDSSIDYCSSHCLSRPTQWRSHPNILAGPTRVPSTHTFLLFYYCRALPRTDASWSFGDRIVESARPTILAGNPCPRTIAATIRNNKGRKSPVLRFLGEPLFSFHIVVGRLAAATESDGHIGFK